MNIFKKKGMATLPIMLVIGMMSLAIVVSITSVAFNELLISQGSTQSSNALSYAESGARDALIRITRNKNYKCETVDCYSLDFITSGCMNGDGCAKISVSSGVGTNNDNKVITSKGISKSSIRTMQVNVVLDDGTVEESLQFGKITSTLWTEIK